MAPVEHGSSEETTAATGGGGDGGGAGGPPARAEGPAAIRYRCAACGNLTRFDVVTRTRTKAFHHYSLGGELALEEVDVLEQEVESVSCRWCGNGDAIELVESEPSAAS